MLTYRGDKFVKGKKFKINDLLFINNEKTKLNIKY